MAEKMGIPKQQIEYLVGNRHVSTSDEEIRKEVEALAQRQVDNKVGGVVEASCQDVRQLRGEGSPAES